MLATFRRYFAKPGAAFGAAIVLFAVFCSVFAPVISYQNPYDLAQLNILDSRLPPASAGSDGYTYWLGTDEQGRDLLSAIFYGLRISLTVAIVSTIFAFLIGTTVGMSAAFFGGKLDTTLMRVVDLQLAFPGILVALVMLAVLGPGLDKVIIAIVTVQWSYYARVARSAALVERSKEYVSAAKGLRFSPARIITFHLLPNSMAALGVLVVVEMASAIALEATLSFLGVGLPITQPSLGLLIANGYSLMLSHEYWISVYPGLVLLALLLGLNLIAERLRQLNDPRGVS